MTDDLSLNHQRIKLKQVLPAVTAWWKQEWHAIRQLRREDWELSVAGQWPVLLKVLITIISQILLIWLGYHHWLAPGFDHWQHLQQRHQQLSEQWQALSPEAPNASSSPPPRDRHEHRGIAPAQVPRWTQQLEQHFNQAKVQLMAFSLAPAQRYADWQAQPFQLQLMGHYSDLARSLGQLSTITPLLTWHDFTLQPVQSDVEEQSMLTPHPDLNLTIQGRLLLTPQEKGSSQHSQQSQKLAESHTLESTISPPVQYQFSGDPNHSPMSPFEITAQSPKSQKTLAKTTALTSPHQSTEANPTAAPKLKLAGIIQYQQQHRALVQTAPQRWVWVQPGDEVAGGYISNITRDQLTWTESLKDETTRHHYHVKAVMDPH